MLATVVSDNTLPLRITLTGRVAADFTFNNVAAGHFGAFTGREDLPDFSPSFDYFDNSRFEHAFEGFFNIIDQGIDNIIDPDIDTLGICQPAGSGIYIGT